MKRVLVVSWALPPILKPRSLQVARVLKALASLGWEIDVITVDTRGSVTARPLDRQLEAHYKGAYSVHRVLGSLEQLTATVFNRILPSYRLLPDVEGGWRRRTVAMARKLLKHNKYDVLLSFAHPWSSHLAAQNIKKISSLPWVAHFSDPWSDNPYYTALTAGQRERMLTWEQGVIQQADQVIFTNQQTSNKVMQKYPDQLRGKASVIPHAFDASLVPEQNIDADGQHLRIVYTGTLYGLRSPETLIRALAKTHVSDQIRIQIAGAIKNKQKYQALADELGVAGSLEFVGQLSYKDSLRLLATADVLLLLDAPSAEESLFLPSKLIDYLMFSKPILGITPVAGASADVLRQLSCPVIAPEDVVGIAAEMERLVDLWRQKKLQLTDNSLETVDLYSSLCAAQKLDRVLDAAQA